MNLILRCTTRSFANLTRSLNGSVVKSGPYQRLKPRIHNQVYRTDSSVNPLFQKLGSVESVKPTSHLRLFSSVLDSTPNPKHLLDSEKPIDPKDIFHTARLMDEFKTLSNQEGNVFGEPLNIFKSFIEDSCKYYDGIIPLSRLQYSLTALHLLFNNHKSYKMIIPEQHRKDMLVQINRLLILIEKISNNSEVTDSMGIYIRNLYSCPVTFGNYYDGVGQLGFILKLHKEYLTTDDPIEKQHYRDILDTLKKVCSCVDSIENVIRNFKPQDITARLNIVEWENLKLKLNLDLDDDIKSNPIFLKCLEELKGMIDININVIDFINPDPNKSIYPPLKSELLETIKKAINDIENDIKSTFKKPVSYVNEYHDDAKRIDVNLKVLDYLKSIIKSFQN